MLEPEEEPKAAFSRKTAAKVFRFSRYMKFYNAEKPFFVSMNWANGEGVRHYPFHEDGHFVQMSCQVAGEKSWALFPYEATREITTLENCDRKDLLLEFDPFDFNRSLSCFPNAER